MTRIDRTPMRAASPGPDGARGAGRLRRSLAAVILALATGLPLRSAGHLLPEADDRFGPFLGI